MTAPARLGVAVRVATVGLALLVVLFPLLYVLRIAVAEAPGTFDQGTTLPSGVGPDAGFTMDNFEGAWSEGGLNDAFIRSLSIVPLGAAIATVVSTLAGFAFAKLDVPARRVWFALLAVTIGVPLPAIAIPLLTQGLDLGYANNPLGLALCYGAVFSVFSTVFMRYYFLDFPDSLLEAARIDGAGTLKVFLYVAVPLAAPAIASVFVLNLLIQWGELLLALVMLPQPGDHTVPVAVAQFTTGFGTAGPRLAAAAVLAALPIVVVVVVAQRWLRTGMRVGAVKA